MTCHNDVPNHTIAESSSLSRSPSTTDFSSLLYKPRPISHKSKKRCAVSFASADQSECGDSENSQVLYMAGSSKQSRKLRGSLSSIGNRSSRIMDGSSDIKADKEKEYDSDEVAWNMIDREIFEWQYVCRTGRPYWWSPESKYGRLKKLPTRLTREPPPRSWMREVDKRPKKDYCNKRRAMSDSYLVGQCRVEDLAHLVAIQLLGSCFTLPPDHTGMLLPDYTSYDQTGPQNSPEPQMISSLRMHTHFRYSPCFGHQARNTSPVQMWLGAYDGPSPASSPPLVATSFQTPVIGTSGSPQRRHRSHRPLNVTEGSENSCFLDNQPEEYVGSSIKDNLDATAPATAWHHRQSIDDDNARRMVLPYLPSQTTGARQRAKTPFDMHKGDDADILESYPGVQSSSYSPKTNYRLQPVIRSEPHHVFVQPVKELVVKRWKTFRRRFGGSLHAPLPTGSEDDMAAASKSGHSGVSSPTMSSDGRARRRRAQERGDIHSGGVSTNSTPHYNSPASGYLSPSGSGYPSPFWVDSMNPSPAFQLADPLTAAAALTLAENATPSVQTPNSTSTPPSTLSESSSSRQIQTPNSTESDHQTSDIVSRREPKPSPNPSYTRRIQKRAHRKSMLSEMHMLEDFADNVASTDSPKEAAERSVLSAAGSILLSPREEAESDIDLAIKSGTRESIGNLGPIGAFSMRRMTVGGTRPCPRLSRTSTSGTQIFTPSDEGVEIDGLPVGPGKEIWDGKRRERTYL